MRLKIYGFVTQKLLDDLYTVHYNSVEVNAMFFSSLVQRISEKVPIEAINIKDIFDIKDIALIDGSQKDFQNDVLYIGYYEQIGAEKLPPHSLLVRTDKTSSLQCTESDLALVEEDKLFPLINAAKALADASRGKGFYAELMDCAAQTKSVSAFVNMAASKLGNSIILLDTDFKILSYSTIYPIDDPLWEQNIRQGYCSYEFISAVNELEGIKNAPNTSEPIAVVCGASPLRKLSSKIFNNGQIIGFTVMLEKESALSPAHFEQLKIVSAAAGDMVSRFAPYLLPDNTQYQRLLYDLLIGAPPEKLSPRIAKLSFPKHMCALCIRQCRNLGQKHLKEQVAEKLKLLLPDIHLTFHGDAIAALIPLGDSADMSQEHLLILDDFAKAEFLRIGISNVFFKIEDFSEQYTQASHALELGDHLKDRCGVRRYMDYAFFDLLRYAKASVNLELFCHPALSLLRKYDHDNNTDLYHTLDTFLSCGCSIKLATEKLFIHRNSLVYRLKRISELTQADLEDFNTRFLLEMSYRIEHFINGAE